MGMYIVNSDVKIVDMEGLKQFINNIEQGKYKEYDGESNLLKGIKIKGKECIIHCGHMEWVKLKPERLGKMPKIRKELADRLFVRNI